MKFLKHLRLLPAVMVLGVALLGMKTTGLVLDARAQDAAAAVPPAPSASEAPAASADAVDDPEATSAQVDVLSSLSKRRSELDARERDIEMRENLIAAAEKRVDGKIADLKQLQTQIQALLQQRDDAQQKQIDSLVKTYSSMKPKDAARIFNNLSDDVLLPVAAAMKPDVLGAILAQMQSDAAQKLTVKLANKLKLPDPPAPTQQMASVIPPPATSAASEPATPSPAAMNTPAPAAPVPATGTQAASIAPSPASGTPAQAPPAPQAPAAGK